MTLDIAAMRASIATLPVAQQDAAREFVDAYEGLSLDQRALIDPAIIRYAKATAPTKRDADAP